MIAKLRGKIIDKKPTEIVIDVNGVGYQVFISFNTFEDIPELNANTELFTYLSVRENSLTLFGFSTMSEKIVFEKLISVSGVGPKLAQSILSGIQTNELVDAIAAGDKSRLVAIPGVGRKTAERLVIELKDKMDSVDTETGYVHEGVSLIKNDAVNALIALGYNKKTAELTVRKILDLQPDISLEELIKTSLGNLTK